MLKTTYFVVLTATLIVTASAIAVTPEGRGVNHMAFSWSEDKNDVFNEPSRVMPLVRPAKKTEEPKTVAKNVKKAAQKVTTKVKTTWQKAKDWVKSKFKKKAETSPEPAKADETPVNIPAETKISDSDTMKETTSTLIPLAPPTPTPDITCDQQGTTWTVPKGTVSVNVQIINEDGSVADSITISRYLTLKPGQQLKVIPTC